MKKVVFSLILLVAVCSCKTKKENEAKPTQMDVVIDIHDEVMPKMGTLARLAEELKSKVDTTAQGQQYEAAMKELQDANKAMMDWMGNFNDRFDSDEILNDKELTPEKKEWLNEEEDKIKALQETVHTSIANAEKLLGKG